MERLPELFVYDATAPNCLSYSVGVQRMSVLRCWKVFRHATLWVQVGSCWEVRQLVRGFCAAIHEGFD